jgi:hypothetical protein
MRVDDPANKTKSTKSFVFVSYPKSGRTWIRYIFHLVGRQVRFTHAGQGTSNPSEIGTKFKRVRGSVLQDKNMFMYRNALDTAVS